jgi:hypothetical protein
LLRVTLGVSERSVPRPDVEVETDAEDNEEEEEEAPPTLLSFSFSRTPALVRDVRGLGSSSPRQ